MKLSITLLLVMFLMRSSAQENPAAAHVRTANEIDMIDIVNNPGGWPQAHRDGQTAIRGCRSSSNLYIIDTPGMRYSDLFQMTCISKASEFKEPRSYILSREQIEQMPVTDLRDMLTIFPGIYQARRGDDLSVFGSRIGGNQYLVDGMH